MSERLLLRGAYVVSMDEGVRELTGDVLIEDGTIAAIGPRLDAGDAELLDLAGPVSSSSAACATTSSTPRAACPSASS